MLLKILGAFDIIGALLLFVVSAGISLPNGILIFFAVAFLAKACIGFFKDVASYFDAFAAILLVLTIFVNPVKIIWIIGGVLAASGIGWYFYDKIKKK